MAAMKSGTSDYWRDYFRSANSDIFEIIEHAIMVAASDCPKEFRLRRDRIAERLFSCKMTRCSGCDRVELAVPGDQDEDGGGCCKSGLVRDGCENEVGGSKGSKVNSTSRDDQDQREMNMINNHVSNYSFGEAEALTDEIEEESQILEEVLRIKDLLDNSEDETDSVLFESLRRLQLMALTVDTLKATEIGKAVNGLRKHASKEIRHLARTLIELWKEMVDEWVNATAVIAEGTPDSMNPSVLDEEEGLPSPPLDEVFFATQPTSMELSQFFDGMDDDGNPRHYGERNKNRDNGRRPSLQNQNMTQQKQKPHNVAYVLPKENNVQQVKKQEALVKPKSNNLLTTESGPGRPPRVNVQQRVSNEMKYQQKPDKVSIQNRPFTTQQDKLKGSEEVKLEATKRKLQERYQQAENAKKQRTIQVMDLHDIPKPKQGLGHRNPHMRPGLHNRHRATGRR